MWTVDSVLIQVQSQMRHLLYHVRSCAACCIDLYLSLVLMPVSVVRWRPSSILIMYRNLAAGRDCCGTSAMYPVQDAVPSLLVAVPFTMPCPSITSPDFVGGAGSGGYAFMTSSTGPSVLPPILPSPP